MSCLGSKHELLQVADHVIAHYYQRVPFVRNHPQAIDLDMKLYQKIDGCSGTIHLKCHRCNTLLRIDLSFRRKK